MLNTKRYTLFMQRYCLVTCGLLLHACAQQTIKPIPQHSDPNIAYEIRQERVNQITQWRMQARIAIRTVNESNTGSLRWLQSPQALSLDIQGPFGINVAKIKGTQDNYTLQDRQGDSWQADNINQLIYNRTGWILPLEQLRYWVLADTQNKNNAAYIVNADGTLDSLQFEQWQIQYEKYSVVDDIKLPTKIRITHPDINIKLSIRQWRLNNG